jgi:hypothetical protein
MACSGITFFNFALGDGVQQFYKAGLRTYWGSVMIGNVYEPGLPIPALLRSPAGLGTARILPLCHQTSIRTDEQWRFCPPRRLGPSDRSLQTAPTAVSTVGTSSLSASSLRGPLYIHQFSQSMNVQHCIAKDSGAVFRQGNKWNV